MIKQHSGFSIAELVIVATLMALLGAIGFVSLQSYVSHSRDTVRDSDIKSIEQGLTMYFSRVLAFPEPANSLQLQMNAVTVLYQGEINQDVLGQLELSDITSGWKDPVDNQYYTYVTDKNRKSYQILGLFENGTELEEATRDPNLEQIYPRTYGSNLGILLVGEIPANRISTGFIDILNETGTYNIQASTSQRVSGTGATITRIICALNPSCSSEDTSLVGYWDMDSTIYDGTTVRLQDFSQYANHGYCQNGYGSNVNCGENEVGPLFTNEVGKYGRAMVFDGGNTSSGQLTDIVSIPDSASLSAQYVSLFARVKRTQGTYAHYIRKGSDYMIDNSAGTTKSLRMATNGNWSDGLSNNGYDDGEYHVYAGTYDGVYAKTYVDGQLLGQTSRTGPINDTTALVHLGARSDAWVQNLSGSIDEVRIYNQGLTHEEVNIISNSMR